MLSDIMAQYGAKLIVAVVVVAAALFLLFLAARAVGRRRNSPFLRGGSNRQPRLAVLDAAAVDQHRRLVLVRRDEVEHLILIGGPSDVVVETGIGAIPARPAAREPQADLPAANPVPANVVPVRPRETRREAAPRIEETPTPRARPEDRVEAGVVQVPEPRPVAEPRVAANERPSATVAQIVPAAERAEPRERPPIAPVEASRRHAEDLLDDARNRVFGAEPEPAREPAPTARFEDVLDARAAGDLSAVTPQPAEAVGRIEPEAPREPELSREPQRKTDPVLDDEMARLLGELTPRK